MKLWRDQVDFLSQSIQLEERGNPLLADVTLWSISIFMAGLIIWSSITSISEIARTPGEIIPQGQQKEIQHLDGGIVTRLNVKDGDMVRKGDVLMILSDDGISEDLQRARIRNESLVLQEERLRANLENRKPVFPGTVGKDMTDHERYFNTDRLSMEADKSVIRNQIAQKQETIRMLEQQKNSLQVNRDVAQNLLNKRTTLMNEGYISTLKYTETEQGLNNIKAQIDSVDGQINVIRSEINESQSRINAMDKDRQKAWSEELNDIILQKNENGETVAKLEDRMARLNIRATDDGIVKGLTVKTTGDIVKPGQTILEIVPMNNGVAAEIKIPPMYIGHVSVGQNVNVKFSSYDFSRYGFTTGTIRRISATTFATEGGGRYYDALVDLQSDHVGHDSRNRIVPGMTVMAEIITGEKTILDYLLKPIKTSIRTSFTER